MSLSHPADNASAIDPVGVRAAFDAVVSLYAGDKASAVGRVILSAKAARAAQKDVQTSLWSGLLALAGDNLGTEHGGAVVRRAASAIRDAVKAEMRVAVGLPRVKPRGSKESGAPDFSTPSVYAKILADAIHCDRVMPGLWLDAVKFVGDKAGTPVELSDSGLPAKKNQCAAAVQRCAEVHTAQVDALLGISTPAPLDVAQLEASNAALRLEVADLRKAGDPAGSLRIARNERDAALAEVQARDAAIADLRAQLEASQAALTAATETAPA